MDCPTCSRHLATEQGMRQHHTKVHGRPLPNRECKGCGSEFYDEKARRVYCGDCNPNAGANNGNWTDAKEQAECTRCGAVFEYYPSNKAGVYCPSCVSASDEFLGEPYRKSAKRIHKLCKHCGTGMSVLRSEREAGRGVFCTHDCRSAWTSEHVRGENHHQWSGGSLNYGRSWWRIRRQALERDNHRCQHCGAGVSDLGQEPDVHHILPVRTFDSPEAAHFLDNVVTLCRSCHRNVESGNLDLACAEE